jgi:hypothetical protein
MFIGCVITPSSPHYSCPLIVLSKPSMSSFEMFVGVCVNFEMAWFCDPLPLDPKAKFM